MAEKWWHKAVIYEIYCRSFCDTDGDGIGDLKGVLSHLNMLHELGVNCIWFTPIYASPQVDNGYDISDYQMIDSCYGTMDDFRTVLHKAHSLGIRILMDMVICHTSDQHPWFIESRKSKDNPYRHFYIWRPARNDGSEPNNWGNYFYEGKGSAWEFDQRTSEYYFHSYSAKMPDLNWDYPPLREKIYQMMRWWLDQGVDGFRIDTSTALKKPEGMHDYNGPLDINGYAQNREQRTNVPGIHAIYREMNEKVFSHYDMFVFGEAGRITSSIAPDYIAPQRHELDSLYHFDVCNRRPAVSVHEYKEIQQRWCSLHDEKNCWVIQHMSNHDYPRQVSKFGDDSTYRVLSAKLLATLIHTLPGIPIIFQGEEIGMTNVFYHNIEDHRDPLTLGMYRSMKKKGKDDQEILDALEPISRDNARTPYQWNDEKNAGFSTGKAWLKVNPNYRKINYQNDRCREDSVFQYYKELICMREKEPAILEGTFHQLLMDHPQVVMFMRVCSSQMLLVIANCSSEKADIIQPEEIKIKKWKRILTNYPKQEPSLRGRKQWLPWEAEVYSCGK